MDAGKRNRQLLSKIATSNMHGEDSLYFDGWKAYQNNPFHPEENPSGVIQMGLAENQLCSDLIKRWIMNNPKASVCMKEGAKEFKDVSIFQDYHGLKEFRQGVAKFMAKTRGNRAVFDPDRIVMSGGATGAHETVAFCLADPGDAFLVPTPYYPGFDRDLRWRTGAKLTPIPCNSSNGFKITLDALEAAWESARKSNNRVKGLIITNPSNPLGTVLDGGTLRSLLRFTNDKNLHFVADEIYAATTFGHPGFTSVAEIINDPGGEEFNRDLIHIIYSLSKDLGLPGFRVGVVYSYNDQVVSCARKMSSFGLVSSQTQYLIGSMLSDDEFVDEFIAKSEQRLQARYEKFVGGFNRLNIKCLKSNAGLFLWMDLRRLLKEQSFESEMELWRVIISEVRLNVSPGSSFHCCEPGWFRLCFANMDEATMETALTRIQRFMAQRENEKANKKRLCWQKSSLRLSFASRRFEIDGLVASPHSPLPHSPLVPART